MPYQAAGQRGMHVHLTSVDSPNSSDELDPFGMLGNAPYDTNLKGLSQQELVLVHREDEQPRFGHLGSEFSGDLDAP